MLRGLIRNCRGLKKKGVATFLKNLIAQYSFHFIGLQEIMIQNCDDKILKKFDIHQDYMWLNNPSKGRSGGILVGIRNEFFDAGSFQRGSSCCK